MIKVAANAAATIFGGNTVHHGLLDSSLAPSIAHRDGYRTRVVFCRVTQRDVRNDVNDVVSKALVDVSVDEEIEVWK